VNGAALRLVIVEDQPLLRDLLADALTAAGVDVVGRAGDVEGALAEVERGRPDAVLLDLRLPPGYRDEGLVVAERVGARHPETGVLLLSAEVDLTVAERLLRLGEPTRGVGYLLKERVGDVGAVHEALQQVVRGDVVVDPVVLDGLLAARARSDPLDGLTAHEQRVLSLVAAGRSNAGIAQVLGCAVGTVEKHLSIVTHKLGLPGPGDTDRADVNVRVLATLLFLRRQGRLQRA